MKQNTESQIQDRQAHSGDCGKQCNIWSGRAQTMCVLQTDRVQIGGWSEYNRQTLNYSSQQVRWNNYIILRKINKRRNQQFKPLASFPVQQKEDRDFVGNWQWRGTQRYTEVWTAFSHHLDREVRERMHGCNSGVFLEQFSCLPKRCKP